MPKLFARVGMEVDITEEELKVLVDCSTTGGSLWRSNADKYSDLEKKAVEIAVKHFRPTGESLDSYIPGCVIEDLAIENGLHKEDNRYNDIDF